MPDSSSQPQPDDAVLGDRAPTPANASILGGIEGVKKRLASSDEREKISALEDALNYQKEGLNLVIHALKDECFTVEQKAWNLLRDRTENEVKKALKEYVSLQSSCGVNYRKLRQLLLEKKWKEADIEMRSLLLNTVNRRDLWLRQQDIPKLPALDLVTCDRLWVKHSQGHFGFSVQAKILAKGSVDMMGWRVDNEMGGRGPWDRVDRIYQKRNISVDLSAPKGFFPLVFELGGGTSEFLPYTTETESVMGFYPIDGYYNKWSRDSFFGPQMIQRFFSHFHQCSQLIKKKRTSK
ncbi:MAG: GUN4 domain-containing protein [Cyanobacteria bacterium SBLK]|nr:GUN4 domain-containing protein [Cyanobacteria bacterium SBLK]